MKKILTLIMSMAMACAALAQDVAARYPDNYKGDAQYRVARAVDPLMSSLGTSTVMELLKFERLDAVDAIGDRGQFTMRSGVVVTPKREADGSLNLGIRPVSMSYEYSAYDEFDCLEMISFLADRYSPAEEPINPCEVVEAGSIDLPVPTGTLRITATPSACTFTLLPTE